MTDLLIDDPKGNPKAAFIFAHGAGAPMDSEFMNIFSKGLVESGIKVIRFEFPYMAKRREDGKRRGPGNAIRLLDDWRQVVGQVGFELPLFIGGKSMGGRLASMIADEFDSVKGLVCLGYPFHPPGKPENLRTEHLEEIKTPSVIIQGERDPFGRPEEVATYGLSDQIRVEWLPDGDHSFKPRKKSGFTEDDNLQKAVSLATDFIVESSEVIHS